MTATKTLEHRASIVDIATIAEGIREFRLALIDSSELPDVGPGGHVGIRLPSGMERDYSIVDHAPHSPELTIAVKLAADGRGGSKEMFGLSEGSVLTVVRHENSFELDETDQKMIFIAGGIGITPIWRMVRHADALGSPWTLHYGAKNESAAAYLTELLELEAANPGRVHLYFSDAGQRMDIAGIVALADDSTGVYCCGPDRITASFRECSTPLGSRAHLEDFTVAELAPGGYEVTLARTGTTLQIPEGSSILDVVLEQGIDVEYSCMSGTCGTCEVAVRAGIPDHQDFVLSDEEHARNDRMMICCSGCKLGPLIIDL